MQRFKHKTREIHRDVSGGNVCSVCCLILKLNHIKIDEPCKQNYYWLNECAPFKNQCVQMCALAMCNDAQSFTFCQRLNALALDILQIICMYVCSNDESSKW